MKANEGGAIDITAAEAAKRLGVSRVTATRWARTGLFVGAWQDSYSGLWHVPEDGMDKAKAVVALRAKNRKKRQR